MAYKAAIPQPNDRIPASQIDILENMDQVFKSFKQDHASLTGGNYPGKHRKLTLPVQAATPVSTSTEQILYSRDDAGTTNIYVAPPSAATEYQFSKGPRLYEGIQLTAYVAFDSKGNILKQRCVKADGSVIYLDMKSPNVSTVTWDSAQLAKYTVNFNPALSTADYFWVIDDHQKTIIPPFTFPTPGRVTPANNATYAATATTTAFKIEGFLSSGDLIGSDTPARAYFDTIFVQIYIA